MYNPKLSPINIFNECSLYFSTHTTQFYVHGTMRVCFRCHHQTVHLGILSMPVNIDTHNLLNGYVIFYN